MKKQLGLWVVFFVICGWGFLCFPDGSEGAAPKEVLIGHLEPLTGGSAATGQSLKMGAEYAVEEINARGGIKSMGGAKLKLIPADHQGVPQVGIAETERLIREGVSMIIGPWYSSIALVATQTAERQKIPFLVDIGIADQITERGLKYTFRMCTPASWIIRKSFGHMMAAAKSHNAVPKTISLIYENSAYGQSNATFMKEACQKGGIQVLLDIPYDRKQMDFSSEVRKIKAANADIIGYTSYIADGIQLLRTMKEQGIRPMMMVGVNDAAFTEMKAFKEALGDYSHYIIDYMGHAMNRKDPRYKALVEGIAKKYKKDADYPVEIGYQSIYLAREVLELAKSSDREKIREAFTKLNYKNHMMASEEPIRFGPDGQNQGADAYFQQVFPDVLTPPIVWPAKFAERKIVWPDPAWKK
ncbi:MAG: ABC transporter substrate-binding protein [Thermodesulfobacteriota bacterium]